MNWAFLHIRIIAVIFLAGFVHQSVYCYDHAISIRSGNNQRLSRQQYEVIKTKSLGDFYRNERLVSYVYTPLSHWKQEEKVHQQLPGPVSIVPYKKVIERETRSNAVNLNQINELCDYYAELISYTPADEYLVQRLGALKEAISNNGICFEKNYVITNNAQQLIDSKGYDVSIYNSCNGNNFQQELHEEFCKTIDQLTYFKDTVSLPGLYLKLHNMSVDFARTGALASLSSLYSHAITLSDFCHASLDLFEALAQGVFKGLK